MKNVNARLDAEWTFTLADAPAPEDTVTLSVRCADGFSATLNGTPIAALNAPVPLEWNSHRHRDAFAGGCRAVAVVFRSRHPRHGRYQHPRDYRAERLRRRPGLLNRVAARLARCRPSFPAYFKTPTPGAANAAAYTAPTPVVTASEPRGYKTQPFHRLADLLERRCRNSLYSRRQRARHKFPAFHRPAQHISHYHACVPR